MPDEPLTIEFPEIGTHATLVAHDAEARVDAAAGALDGRFALRIGGQTSAAVGFDPRGANGRARVAVRAIDGGWEVTSATAVTFPFPQPFTLQAADGPQLTAERLLLSVRAVSTPRVLLAAADVGLSVVAGQAPRRGDVQFPDAFGGGAVRSVPLRTAPHPDAEIGDAHFFSWHPGDRSQLALFVGPDRRLAVGHDAGLFVGLEPAHRGQFAFIVPPRAETRGTRSSTVPALTYLPVGRRTHPPVVVATADSGVALAATPRTATRSGSAQATARRAATPQRTAAHSTGGADWDALVLDARAGAATRDGGSASDTGTRSGAAPTTTLPANGLRPAGGTRSGTRGGTRSDVATWIATTWIGFDGMAIRATEFDADEVIVSESGDGTGEGVAIRDTADRFGVHIVPNADGTRGSAMETTVVYRGRDARDAVRDRFDRTRGLQVPGLRSTRGRVPRLDATLAQVERVPTADGASTRFGVRAGHTEDVAAADRRSGVPGAPVPTERSRVTPKPAATRAGTGTSGSPASTPASLDIPVGGVTVRLEDDPARPDGPITIDAAAPVEQRVRFRHPRLLGVPAGCPSTAGAAAGGGARGGVRTQSDAEFAPWVLVSDDEPFDFAASEAGLVPRDPAWVDRFQPETQSHELLGYPGATLRFGDPVTGGRTRRGEADATKVNFETRGASAKEYLVYSAFFAALGYKAVDSIVGDDEAEVQDDRIVLKFADLGTPSGIDVKSRDVDDLRIVLPSVAPGPTGLRAWIDALAEGKPNAKRIVWPILGPLGVVLRDTDDQGTLRYCDELIEGLDPLLAIDLGGATALDPKSIGLGSWEEAAKRDPDLWPRGRTKPGEKGGASRDPSEARWRGIFMRNMPMRLVPERSVQQQIDRLPMVAKLIDLMTNQLVLEYGWKDEKGSTWRASLVGSKEHELIPESLRSIISVVLTEVSLKGTNGKPRLGIGKLDVALPFLKVKGASGTPEPLAFQGTFRIKLDGRFGVESADIVPKDPEQVDIDIPGFAKIQPLRFRTDFRTIDAHVRLVPGKDLAAVLPFLEPHVDAVISIDPSGEKPAAIELKLPSEQTTNACGKWPISVQSIRLELDDGGVSAFMVKGAIDLGLPDFSRIGATVRVKDDRVTFSIDDVRGAIGIGGFKAKLAVKWGDGSDVDLTNLAERPADLGRSFIGSLEVERGDILSPKEGAKSFGLHVRIGTVGDLAYWVAALNVDRIGFGSIGSLSDASFVLAVNADYAPGGGEGQLATYLADVGKSAKDLAPVRPGPDPVAWLEEWSPSEDIGLFVAASGLLDMQAGILSKPKDERTLVAFTDSGLIRVDAAAKLFGLDDPIRFAIFIDWAERTLKAAIDLPAIHHPTSKNPEFTIRGGRLMIGLGLKGKVYFLASVGWPELIGDSQYERDWDTSVKVLWDNTIPINTFWGGMRCELDSDAGTFFLGYALRAGWTKSYSVGGGVAKGSAELGVAVGGVVGFQIGWGGAGDSRLRALPATRGEGSGLDALAEARASLESAAREGPQAGATRSAEAVRAAREDIDVALRMLADIEQRLERRTRSVSVGGFVTLYADIWGKASAELFGVTLVAVSVSGHARFHVCFDGFRVSQCVAEVGFELSVEILCVTFTASCTITVWLKRGTCSSNRLRGVSEPALIEVKQPTLPEGVTP